MIKIERVQERNYPNVEKFIKKYHSNPEWLWTIEDDMKRPNLKQFSIKTEDDKLVGITSFQRFSNTLGILQKHIIRPKYRGLGYSKKALELIEKYAADSGIYKMAAYVLDKNDVMKNQLLKAGYVIEGHLKDHFDDGLGCFVFGKKLKEISDDKT